MKLSALLGTTLLFGAVFVSCSDSDNGGGNSVPVNPPVRYTNASLVYYGDEGYTGESCEFTLTMYTDMKIDDTGNPIGPGKILQLDFNAELFDDDATEFPIPAGKYYASASDYSFSPFSFNWGYVRSFDLPGQGSVSIPVNSFYGEIPAGSTAFDPDLLDEGAFEVEVAGDGSYTVAGCVVGDKFMKRNFIFSGKLTAADRRGDVPGPKPDNTTLAGDLVLDYFTQARLRDLGQPIPTGDESYRAFELILADDAADLDMEWPSKGRMLKVTLFVAYGADVADGIPAGEYTMTTDRSDGGVDRDEMVPFRVRCGVPDLYSHPSGTWYLDYTSGSLGGYARINGGRMRVERDGDAHTIEIEFTDCAENAHRVSCSYSQRTPMASL